MRNPAYDPAMRPPTGLDARGRAAYRHAWAVLEAVGEDPELSSDAIRRYADAVSEAAALRTAWLSSTSKPSALESLLRSIDRAEDRAGSVGADLGLTPAARRKLGRSVWGGRPQGAASAADRRTTVSRRRGKVAPIRPTVQEMLDGDASSG